MAPASLPTNAQGQQALVTFIYLITVHITLCAGSRQLNICSDTYSDKRTDSNDSRIADILRTAPEYVPASNPAARQPEVECPGHAEREKVSAIA